MMLSGKGGGSARDNQEVCLEAAILERVRNSSLVKRLAPKMNGTKHHTEAVDLFR
jgi:hypothetical protein